MSNLFFSSDWHLFHGNMLNFMNRPFKDVFEQNEKLIENFNSKVSKNSHTWHLGDFIWRTAPLKDALDICYRLNGTHSFVPGNHDQIIEANPVVFGKFFKEMFLPKDDEIVAKVLNIGTTKKPKKLVLCHYALRVWPQSHRGSWHLYGHSHGELPPAGFSFDVGIDSSEAKYFPLELEEIRENMSHRECNHKLAKVWTGKKEVSA